MCLFPFHLAVLGSHQRTSSSFSRGIPWWMATGALEEPGEQGRAGMCSLPEWWHLFWLRARWACSAALHSSNWSSKNFLPKEQPFPQSLASLGELSEEQTQLWWKGHIREDGSPSVTVPEFSFLKKKVTTFFKRSRAVYFFPCQILSVDIDMDTFSSACCLHVQLFISRFTQSQMTIWNIQIIAVSKMGSSAGMCQYS